MDNRCMLILLVLLLVNPAECAGVHFAPLRQNGKDTYVTNTACKCFFTEPRFHATLDDLGV